MSWCARKWAKDQTALPRKPHALLRHLADFANDEGQCWPDQDELVACTAWAKGTIKRWTDFLRALDLVATKKRFNRRKGHCDALLYTLNLGRVVTPDDVQRQIANLRFVSVDANRKNGGGKSQPTANNPIEPQGAGAASAPPGALAGRAAPPTSDLKPQTSPPVAARARELTLTGSRPRTTAGPDPHEHEARHEPIAQPTPPTLRRMTMPDPPPRDPAEVAAEYSMLAKVQAWQETGRWDRADGPPPFAPGCTVPPELLPQRIRLARKDPAPPGRTAGELVERLIEAVERRAA